MTEPTDTNNSEDERLSGFRRVRSRSGHELIFDDTDAAERIEIRTPGGATITIDSSSGTVTVEGTASLEIKSAQLEIEAAGAMNIKASGSLTVSGASININ